MRGMGSCCVCIHTVAMAVGKASSGLYGLYSQVGSLRTHFTDIIMQRVAVNSGWGVLRYY